MLEDGRERGRRVRGGRVRVRGHREPADRARARAGSCSCTARGTARPARRLLRRRARARARVARARRRWRRSTSASARATTTQAFRIGPASCAVPGAVAGLEAVHRAYGRLPWRELLAPAVELARDGVELTRSQAHMHAILDPILRFDDGGPARVRQDGIAPRRGRPPPIARPRRHARGDRAPRRGGALRGRPRAGDRLDRPRRRRRAHARRPRASTGSSGGGRSRSPSAATRCSPTRRRRRAAC